jgi:hypothetical protein
LIVFQLLPHFDFQAPKKALSAGLGKKPVEREGIVVDF